jgi:hypothetical protein
VINYDASTMGKRRAIVVRWDFNQASASFEPDMQHELDLDRESLKTPLATLS